MKYDIKIILAWSTDICIHIEIKWTTVVLVLNEILVSGHLEWQWPSWKYLTRQHIYQI